MINKHNPFFKRWRSLIPRKLALSIQHILRKNSRWDKKEDTVERLRILRILRRYLDCEFAVEGIPKDNS